MGERGNYVGLCSRLTPRLSTMQSLLGVLFKRSPKFEDECLRLTVYFSLIWRVIMATLTRCCNYDENSRILKTARETADEENVANTKKP